MQTMFAVFFGKHKYPEIIQRTKKDLGWVFKHQGKIIRVKVEYNQKKRVIEFVRYDRETQTCECTQPKLEKIGFKTEHNSKCYKHKKIIT